MEASATSGSSAGHSFQTDPESSETVNTFNRHSRSALPWAKQCLNIKVPFALLLSVVLYTIP
jgi:hypothetical protein